MSDTNKEIEELQRILISRGWINVRKSKLAENIIDAGYSKQVLRPLVEDSVAEVIRQNGEYKENHAIGLMDMVEVHVKTLAKAICARFGTKGESK